MSKPAYILDQFPALSEAFVVRELRALRDREIDAAIFALRPSDTLVMDSQSARFLYNTYYRPGLLTLVPRFILSKLAFLLGHPRRYFRAVRLIHTLKETRSPWSSLKAFYHFMTAIVFARRATALGITHIHAHFAFLPAQLGRIVAELINRPLSVSAHARDIYAQPVPALRRRLESAGRIFACTRDGVTYLESNLDSLPARSVSYMPHGLFPEDYPSTHRPGNARRILAVGRLEPKKGFRILIEACSHLREKGYEFTCEILGRGSQQQELEELIRTHNLDQHVYLAGAVGRDKLLSYYANSGVLALPSIVTRNGDRDGLPNVLLEAMASGLPVISTTACAAGDALTDGEEGYIVPPEDAETLADRLTTCLLHPERAIEMGTAGRRKVAQDFDARTNIDPLVKHFARTDGLVMSPSRAAAAKLNSR